MFIAYVASDFNTYEKGITTKKIQPKFLPFNLSSIGGMEGHSKCTKKGGGSFSTDYFCMCCDEVRSNSYLPKPNLYSSICDELHSEI